MSKLSSIGLACTASMLLLLTCGCSGPKESAPVIVTSSEYSDYLAKAQELSESSLKKFDEGGELSDEEKKNLKEAARIADAMAAFKPTNFANHLLAGKCYFAIEDYHAAEPRFKTAIKVIDPNTTVPILITSRAEALYLHARSLEMLQAYEDALIEAQSAVDAFPDNPNYLAELASAGIQTATKESMAAAKVAIGYALEIDPKHARALSLKKLIESGSK